MANPKTGRTRYSNIEDTALGAYPLGMTEANPEPLIVKTEGPVGVLQLHRPRCSTRSIPN